MTESKENGSLTGYMPALDCMRGFAILLVLLHHVKYRFPGLAVDPFTEFMSRIGWAGVDLFFAISGYLITSILLRSDGKLAPFFIKRVFRIIPLYIVAVVVYLILGEIRGFSDVENIWIPLLLLTGWVAPFVDNERIPYLITWSISVEESAYIFFGLVSKFGSTLFVPFLWLLVVAGVMLRWVLVANNIFEVQHVYYFPPTRIDSIAIGGLMFVYTSRWRPKVRILEWLVLISFFIVFWLGRDGQYNHTVAILGYTLFSVMAALWVVYLADVRQLSNPVLRAFAYIGRRSYFFYLFHVFLIGIFGLGAFSGVVNGLGFWGVVSSVTIVTLILGEISWRFFESPMIKFGRRLAAITASDT